MKKRIYGTILAVMTGLAIMAGHVPNASADPSKELKQLPPPLRQYVIKAAFLYNFARYTEWPQNAFQGTLAPLRLCILGNDPFGPALQSIAGKRVQNRTIMVIHLIWAEDAPQCHMLFITASAQGHLKDLFKTLEGKPVLTISDTPDTVHAGGVIGLEMVEKKVRFRINLDNADSAGLKLSSRVLNLAAIVRNETLGETLNRQTTAVPNN